MFTELLPLLADRTLILTIARIDDDLIRVNVLPKALKENDSAERALTTPLSMTGCAADLDRELSAQLSNFTASFLETRSTLAQLQETHRAALKEVEAENKKTFDSKRKTGSPKTPAQTEDPANTTGPVFKDGKPVFGTKQPTRETASLFDAPCTAASSRDRKEAEPAEASATNGNVGD